MDGSTLAARSKEGELHRGGSGHIAYGVGTLLLKDLRGLAKPVEEVALDDPILGVQIMRPQVKHEIGSSLIIKGRSARLSLNPSSVTSSRGASVLGEVRNAGNIDKSSKESLEAPSKGAKGEQATHNITEKKKVVQLPKEPGARNVSAPSWSRAPKQAMTRSPSGPLAPSSTMRPPFPSVRATPAPIVEEEEEFVRAEMERLDPSIDLNWALRPHSRASLPESIPRDDVLEEMRREIANLQLDMLRMGRNLKVSLPLRLWLMR